MPEKPLPSAPLPSDAGAPLPAADVAEARSVFTKIAAEIVSLDEAVKQLDAGPLKRRAICLLLKDITNISLGDIDTVLRGLRRLRSEYLK
jgi:hypothetical protein